MLLANAAGALAVIGISGGFASGGSWRDFFRDLAVSLVFANCIGTTLAIGISAVAERCWSREPRTRWIILIASMVVLTFAGTFVAVAVLWVAGAVPPGGFMGSFLHSLSVSLVISLIIGVGITAYESLRGQLEQTTVALRTRERNEADARRLAAEAQFASLESRVRPHFLFNTLNSTAELIHGDPEGAERMTGQLAALLRSSLDESAPLASLEQELQVVRAYLEIERVRFGDRLRYDIGVDDAVRAVQVPRLSVQTLVENSIKYAVSPQRAGASVQVRASAQDGHVRVEVADDGPGFDPGLAPAGHGIALLRARLAMTFGDRAALSVDRQPGRTSVAMDVPVA